MYATELASTADDAVSAIAVGCLLLATAVIAYGFIARERIPHPKRSAGRTGPGGAEQALTRTALLGGAAVLIGHIAGSAARSRWTLPWDLALEVLIYALALQFFEFAAKWRDLTPSTRRLAVAGLVLMAFVGSASWAYTDGIL